LVFEKKQGFVFKLAKHTDYSEQWNKLCTAKLEEVIQSGRDAFACQALADKQGHGGQTTQ